MKLDFFFQGSCCTKSSRGLTSEEDRSSLINEDDIGVMERSTDSFVSSGGQEVAVEIPDSVSNSLL